MSKKSISLSLLLGFVFFLILLLKQLPANLVLAHLANQTSAFVPHQVSGTLWQGQAANVSVIAGPIPVDLGQVQWEISPWALLTGTLALHINAENGRQKIKGDIALGLGESIEVNDLELVVDGAMFRSLLPIPINYQGFIELSIQELSASQLLQEKPEIHSLAANLVVDGLAINFGSEIMLGKYGARLSLADKKIEGESIVSVSLSDIDGSVSVQGTADALLSTQQYFVDINLTPKPTASPLIMQTLSQFYKRQSDGAYKVTMGKAL